MGDSGPWCEVVPLRDLRTGEKLEPWWLALSCYAGGAKLAAIHFPLKSKWPFGSGAQISVGCGTESSALIYSEIVVLAYIDATLLHSVIISLTISTLIS